MPDVGFDFKLNTGPLMASVRKLMKLYKDPKEFYPVFVEAYFLFRKRAFASRGSSVGSPWSSLTPGYLETKRKRGYPSDPWMLTGRTRKALTGGRGGGRRVSKTKKRLQVRLGSYPGFHDSKHGTVHPFYILSHFRPVQTEEPTTVEMRYLEKKLLENLDKFNSKLSGKA